MTAKLELTDAGVSGKLAEQSCGEVHCTKRLAVSRAFLRDVVTSLSDAELN